MSSWTIQLGDLAQRLGRGFGITGKVATQLTDPVLPVCVVQDVTKLPYADEPRYFRAAGTFVSQNVPTGFLAIQGVAPRTVITNCYMDGAANLGPYAPLLLFRGIGGPAFTPGAGFALNVKGPSAVKGQAASATGPDVTVLTGAGQTLLVVQQLSPVRGIDLMPLVGPVVLFPGDGFVLQFFHAINTTNWGVTWAEYSR